MVEPVLSRTLWSEEDSSLQDCSCINGKISETKLVPTRKKFYGRHYDLVNPYNVAVSRKPKPSY